jgi:putative Mn2+ efflux pump MntP
VFLVVNKNTLLYKKMTNKTILGKGIKYLTGALPLIFIGPSVIFNAFMNQQNNWHYLVLAIGILACLGAMLLLFLGCKLIVKSMFDSE